MDWRTVWTVQISLSFVSDKNHIEFVVLIVLPHIKKLCDESIDDNNGASRSQHTVGQNNEMWPAYI